MTLQDLYDRLAPEFPESARKDLKTAVRVLAHALDCADPQHCALETFNCPLPSLYRLVERSLSAQGKKPHTVRNIKNYLSRLFRLAEAHQLFSLTSAPIAPRYQFRDKVPLLSVQGTLIHQNRGTHLSYAQWPPDLQNAFAAFQTWATAPVVPGREPPSRNALPLLRAIYTPVRDTLGFFITLNMSILSRLTTSLTFPSLPVLSTGTSMTFINAQPLPSTTSLPTFLRSLANIVRCQHSELI
jgi:hypothetical protein